MPFNEGIISIEVIAAFAQILPTLLAIGLLVPIVAGISLSTPELLFFGSQTLVVLATETLLLWFLLEGNPVDGGWRLLIWVSTLYAVIGVAGVTIGWQREKRRPRGGKRTMKEHPNPIANTKSASAPKKIGGRPKKK